MPVPVIRVIGSLNTDLVSRTSRIPDAGETIASKSFTTGSGGKGANQAVACGRLSRRRNAPSDGDVEVQMSGAVGDDIFGQSLLDDLKGNGINVDGVVVRKGDKSGVAVIIVEESGENRILISPNANYSLKPAHFADLKIPLPNIIVLQLEIPLDTVLQILQVANREGVEVILNPAPAQVLPQEAYKMVTHLIVNESEAATITETTSKSVDWTAESPERQKLFDLGSKHIIVTLGSKGGQYFSLADGKSHVFSAKKVSVRDTTAAGDTFVGAYAVALAKNSARDVDSMARAVEWANEAASLAVQREGAQASIPWKDDLPPL